MKITDNALADKLDLIKEGSAEEFLEIIDRVEDPTSQMKLVQEYIRQFKPYKKASIIGVTAHDDDDDDFPEDGSYFTWEIKFK